MVPHKKTERTIQLDKLPVGSFALVSIVADVLSNTCTVVVFDKTVVILVGSSTTSERDMLLLAGGQQGKGDELAAIVRIETLKRKWYHLLGTLESLENVSWLR